MPPERRRGPYKRYLHDLTIPLNRTTAWRRRYIPPPEPVVLQVNNPHEELGDNNDGRNEPEVVIQEPNADQLVIIDAGPLELANNESDFEDDLASNSNISEASQISSESENEVDGEHSANGNDENLSIHVDSNEETDLEEENESFQVSESSSSSSSENSEAETEEEQHVPFS